MSKPDLLGILQKMPHHTQVFDSDTWYSWPDLFPIYAKIYQALRPVRLMELGCFMGAGLISAIYGADTLKWICWVDNESAQVDSNNLAYANINYACKLLDKAPELTWWKTRPSHNPMVDVIHIDADHSYNAAKADLEYAYSLAPNYIMGHDLNLPGSGVLRAVQEFCYNHNLTFIEIPVVYGAFVIPLLEHPEITAKRLHDTGVPHKQHRRKVIATLARGDGIYRRMLEVSIPLFCRYGARHNYDVIADHTVVSERPVSWWKIPMVKSLLNGPYDTVLWLDSDLAITDGRDDLDLLVPDNCIHGLVAHHCSVGWVPNCGMWLMRRGILPYLDQAWTKEEYINHPWWEQAAMHTLLGIDPASPKAVEVDKQNELYKQTHWLPYEWNVHPLDARGIPDRVRVYHASCCSDRVGTLKSWADKATW